MTLAKWTPHSGLTKQEQLLMARLGRTKKLFGFLREHRARLFDDAFQEELAAMYRDNGGKSPVAPAMMAMATLLQGYVAASDAEAVELTVVDLRWQMVLDCLGAERPPFSQGALHDFRHRMIRHDMDRRLLERTAELARETRGFDPKKLPKTLRVAMDSMPLEGAGRVEDSFNLLAHAARQVLTCAASLLSWSEDRLARKTKTRLFTASSVKGALDVNWSDRDAKQAALQRLTAELDRLESWIAANMAELSQQPPLDEHLATLKHIREQDLEPDPPSGGTRIRKGVALERRISVEDKEMRHGRKSKTKRIDGYKRHIAVDVDLKIIFACAVTPANRPEFEAAALLHRDMRSHNPNVRINELFVDRGYIKAPLVHGVLNDGGAVFCKPWRVNNGPLFRKTDFHFDFRRRLVTCPAGQSQHFEFGTTLEFSASVCRACPMRARCVKNPSSSRGRMLKIADDELLQHRFRALLATPSGRAKLRERVVVEHQLSHAGKKQGRRARYRGVRSNVFDFRRSASLVNLENAHLACAA